LLHGRDASSLEPTRIAASQHIINVEHIDAKALNVVSTLQKYGHEAYLVGGCVRDLLCQITPKDFDVATSAAPEKVRPLFARCRLIGRRFRLAHVVFGREVIEVATFRREAKTFARHFKRNKQGLLHRDNAYGTLVDDVMRRDFSVNALYYNPSTEEIIDFVDNSSVKLFKKIQKIIEDLRKEAEIDPIEVTCPECEHKFSTPLIFDYSHFFG